MRKDLPSPELLRKLLRYEPDTGKLFWRERTPGMFDDSKSKAKRTCAAFNTRLAGRQSFTSVDTGGYMYGRFANITHRAHRLIWAMEVGEWPIGEIDHKDGDRANNRLVNLRVATPQENQRNRGMGANNTSGQLGVGWSKGANKWRVQISVSGRGIHLGYFGCFTAALVSRKAAEIKYGFHKNHGRNYRRESNED